MLSSLILCVTMRSLVLATSCLMPGTVYFNLSYFLKHFNVDLLTVIPLADDPFYGFRTSFECQSLVRILNKDNIRVNVVPLNALQNHNYARGAVMMPVSPLANLTNLVLQSSASKPLFLYSVDASSSLPPCLQALKHVPYSSRVYVLSRDGDGTRGRTLLEVYHAGEPDSPLLVNVVGKELVDGSWRFGVESALVRRSNLHGAAVRLLYPAFMFDAVDTTGLGRDLWLVRSYLQLAMETMNVSVSETVSSPVADVTAVWSDLLGYFVRREVDLCLISINPSSALAPHLDFTQAFATSLFKLYIRKPATTYSLETMFKGFAVPLWLACGLSLALLSCALYVVTNAASRAESASYADQPMDFSECLLTVFGNYCAKGWPRVPLRTAARVLCACCALLGFLLNVAYVSQLQANLAARAAPLPFESLDELVNGADYAVLMAQGSLAETEAAEATEGTMKRVRDLMVRRPDSVVGSYVEGLTRVCAEQAALMGISVTCDTLLRRAPCDIVDTRATYYFRTLALPVRKGFALKELISYNIRRCKELGLLHPLLTRHLIAEHPDLVAAFEPATHFAAVEFLDVAPFFVLFAGFLVPVAWVLLLELAHFRLVARRGPAGNNAKLCRRRNARTILFVKQK